MPYSANETTLSYRSGQSSFTELEYLMEVPEFGGTPEKIDITTLSDKVKKYIPGTKDYGDLVFKFLYDNANYSFLKDRSDSENPTTFRLTYPDGTSHEFDAVPSVKIDSGTVNGALTFSATMMLQSDIR